MVEYKEFYNSLLNNRLIMPIWEYILELIEKEIYDNVDKHYYLILFSIYFSLVDDGNICMSLDKEKLRVKWIKKLDSTKILLENNIEYSDKEYNELYSVSIDCIDNHLDSINIEKLTNIIGDNKIFDIEDNYLYLKKYNIARKGISESINRLFNYKNDVESNFNYKDCVNENFVLSNGQENAVKEGFNKNLIITGGPGTGKTTSILFLLLGLLEKSNNKKIYLVAPSGKASSRMKESIINGLINIKDEYKENNSELIDIINNLEESTIHRLLGINLEDNTFLYNKRHQFSNDSIFVIDEASMIDICLFNSLLEAIPTTSRIFIMGDKNQLPSVECGAVFGDLLKKESLKENIVELDESIRFGKETKIYELANAINNGGILPIIKDDWLNFDMFEIQKDSIIKPIYYYKNTKDDIKEKDIVEHITYKWGKEYFNSLQEMSSELDYTNIDELKNLFSYSEKSKILCAENEGIRGVKYINKYLKKTFIDFTKKTSIIGHYPGQIMMINKNNKMLDLYNGDSGILVTFKNDKTLYFMVKKSSNLVRSEGKKDDTIFKIGDYVFYPFRLITNSEIDLAYAITIHKSQGSDYKNILVILPSHIGHPLLNRQIVYTAITRTKGNTYILASQEILEEAKDRLIERDTNI